MSICQVLKSICQKKNRHNYWLNIWFWCCVNAPYSHLLYLTSRHNYYDKSICHIMMSTCHIMTSTCQKIMPAYCSKDLTSLLNYLTFSTKKKVKFASYIARLPHFISGFFNHVFAPHTIPRPLISVHKGSSTTLIWVRVVDQT